MVKKTIDISIIIPVYKVQNYILETLQSVVGQSTDCKIECILVDDCGNDNSMNIAMEFIRQYKGNVTFLIIGHDKNKGASAARNTGIKNSQGKYLFFLDSDDLLYPDSISKLWSFVRRYPNIDIVKGDFVIENLTKSILNKKWNSYTEDVSWIRKHMCNLSIPESMCNSLIKRDLIAENNLFFMEGTIEEDTLMVFKLQRYIKKMAFCFEPTYFYRINPNSVMHRMNKEKAARVYSFIFNEAYRDMLHGEVALCELIYLEQMASRVYNSVGVKGLKMLCANDNMIFNRLFICNQKLYNKNNKYMHIFFKMVRVILRRMLCYKAVFRYRKNNDDTI